MSNYRQVSLVQGEPNKKSPFQTILKLSFGPNWDSSLPKLLEIVILAHQKFQNWKFGYFLEFIPNQNSNFVPHKIGQNYFEKGLF